MDLSAHNASGTAIAAGDSEPPACQYRIEDDIITMDFPEEEVDMPVTSGAVELTVSSDRLFITIPTASTGLDESEPSGSSIETHGVFEEHVNTAERSEVTVCSSVGTVRSGTVNEASGTRKRAADRCINGEDEIPFHVPKRGSHSAANKKRNLIKTTNLQIGLSNQKHEATPTCVESPPSTSTACEARQGSRKRPKAGVATVQNCSAKDVGYLTSATQTAPIDDVAEEYVKKTFLKIGLQKCADNLDLNSFGKHYARLRYVMIRHYLRMCELEKENVALKGRLKTVGEKVTNEIKQQHANFDAIGKDFKAATAIIVDYHKAFLRSCDEIDARCRGDKKDVIEAMNERTAACTKLEDLLNKKSEHIDALKKEIEDLNRRLAIENRDTYLAKQQALEADQRVLEADQRAAGAKKKLDDQLYMACKTKCPSCKVYEKNRSVLYSQIADQTVIHDNAMKENRELRSKCDNYEKANEKLEKEVAFLNFEKRSWEVNAKRLEDELKNLKAAGGISSSVILTPCPSNNSTSSEEMVDVQCKKCATPVQSNLPELLKTEHVRKDVNEEKQMSPAVSNEEAKKQNGEETQPKKQPEYNFAPLSTDASLLNTPFAFSAWAKHYQNQKPKSAEKLEENVSTSASAVEPSKTETLGKSGIRKINAGPVSKYSRQQVAGTLRTRNEKSGCDRPEERTSAASGTVARENTTTRETVMAVRQKPQKSCSANVQTSAPLNIFDRIKNAVSSVELTRKEKDPSRQDASGLENKSTGKEVAKRTAVDAHKEPDQLCKINEASPSIAKEKRGTACQSTSSNDGLAPKKCLQEKSAHKETKEPDKFVSIQKPISERGTGLLLSKTNSVSPTIFTSKGSGPPMSDLRFSNKSVSDRNDVKTKKSLLGRPPPANSPSFPNRESPHPFSKQSRTLLDPPRGLLEQPRTLLDRSALLSLEEVPRSACGEVAPPCSRLGPPSEFRNPWEKIKRMECDFQRPHYADVRDVRDGSDAVFERNVRPSFFESSLPRAQESWRSATTRPGYSRQDECWNGPVPRQERFGYPDESRW